MIDFTTGELPEQEFILPINQLRWTPLVKLVAVLVKSTDAFGIIHVQQCAFIKCPFILWNVYSGLLDFFFSAYQEKKILEQNIPTTSPPPTVA